MIELTLTLTLTLPPILTARPVERLAVGELNLRRAWESSQRSTVEDWFEWMRYFSVELLRESPSPALRATAPLAQVSTSSRWLALSYGCMNAGSQVEQSCASPYHVACSPTVQALRDCRRLCKRVICSACCVLGTADAAGDGARAVLGGLRVLLGGARQRQPASSGACAVQWYGICC